MSNLGWPDAESWGYGTRRSGGYYDNYERRLPSVSEMIESNISNLNKLSLLIKTKTDEFNKELRKIVNRAMEEFNLFKLDHVYDWCMSVKLEFVSDAQTQKCWIRYGKFEDMYDEKVLIDTFQDALQEGNHSSDNNYMRQPRLQSTYGDYIEWLHQHQLIKKSYIDLDQCINYLRQKQLIYYGYMSELNIRAMTCSVYGLIDTSDTKTLELVEKDGLLHNFCNPRRLESASAEIIKWFLEKKYINVGTVSYYISQLGVVKDVYDNLGKIKDLIKNYRLDDKNKTYLQILQSSWANGRYHMVECLIRMEMICGNAVGDSITRGQVQLANLPQSGQGSERQGNPIDFVLDLHVKNHHKNKLDVDTSKFVSGFMKTGMPFKISAECLLVYLNDLIVNSFQAFVDTVEMKFPLMYNKGVLDDQLAKMAVSGGFKVIKHLDFVRTKFDPTVPYNSVYAIINADLKSSQNVKPVLDWALIYLTTEQKNSLCDQVIQKINQGAEQLMMFEWCMEHTPEGRPKLFSEVMKQSSYVLKDIIRIADDTKFEYKIDMTDLNVKLKTAFEKDDVGSIEWALEKKLMTEINADFMANLSKHNAIAILKFVLNSGVKFEYDERCIDTASVAAHIPILDTWLKSGFEMRYTAKAIDGLYKLPNKSKIKKKVYSWWKNNSNCFPGRIDRMEKTVLERLKEVFPEVGEKISWLNIVTGYTPCYIDVGEIKMTVEDEQLHLYFLNQKN